MKSIFKAVATVTIFSIITRLLGFFFRVFLSRKLGAEGLGLFQMASSVLGIFLTLISSGIPLTTAKFVSKYETNGEYKKRNKVVTSALIIALVVALASSGLIYILKSVFNVILTDSRAVEILIILIPSIACSAVYAVFRGALWGQNDYFNCGLTELFEQIVRFALTIIFLNKITDTFVATKYSAVAFNITCLVSALLTMILYLRRCKLNFRFGEYKNIIKSALPITGIRVANSLVQPITTLIMPTMLVLAGYTTSQAVSSFGVVMGMTFPMLFVPMTVIGSISMVLIPSISSMLSKKQYSTIQENVKKSLEISIFLSMIFVPLYISVGDLIGVVLFDNLMSGKMLQLASMCVLPITICNLTGSVLDALNLEVKSFINYIIGSVLLFVSLVIFTPIMGVASIIIAYFISMLTISLLNLRMIKKSQIKLNFNLFNISFKYILIISPCCLLGNWISQICLHFFNNFFSAVLGGGITILAVLILTKIFNIFNIFEIKELLLKRKKSHSTE